MAIAVQLTNVRKVAATGRIYLQWSDGVELEFQNLQEIKDWAQEADFSSEQAKGALRKLLARWYFIRDPNGTTPSTVNGKTITLDLGAASNLLTVL